MSAATLTSPYTIIDQEPERVGRWMQREGAAHYRDGCTCIGLERDGRLQAGAMFDYYTGTSVFAHIAIRGRITREWLWFICYYPFVTLNCEVLIGLVPRGNVAAQRFDEHFGFKKQLDIPGGDPSGGLLIYTLRKEDCRFLTRRPRVQI